MVGIDRRGPGSTSNYMLVGGKVYWTDVNSNGRLDENWKEMGCVPRLDINMTSQLAEHECPSDGPLVVDASNVSRITASMSGQFDDMKFETLALVGLGNTEEHEVIAADVTPGVFKLYVPNPAYLGSDVTDKRVVARSYGMYTDGTDVEAGATDPTAATGAAFNHTLDRQILSTGADTFAVTSLSFGATVITLGTPDGDGLSYNAELGLIEINGEDLLSTAALAAINAMSTPTDEPFTAVTVTTTGTIAATTHDRVLFLTGSTRSIAIRFLGLNIQTGKRVEIIMPKAVMRPDGDLNAVSAGGYASFPFTGSLEKNVGYAGTNGGFFTMRNLD